MTTRVQQRALLAAAVLLMLPVLLFESEVVRGLLLAIILLTWFVLFRSLSRRS